MLNPKEWNYVNLGLDNNYKCVYCRQQGNRYMVLIDTAKCKMVRTSIYNLKFEDEEKANDFAKRYISYNKYEFDVVVEGNCVIIEPISIRGIAQIDCGQNKEMAKKLVKTLRLQFMKYCRRQILNEKNRKKDFKGLQF